jgi:hypothetical protein
VRVCQIQLANQMPGVIQVGKKAATVMLHREGQHVVTFRENYSAESD